MHRRLLLNNKDSKDVALPPKRTDGLLGTHLAMEDNTQPLPSTNATQTTQSSPADHGFADLNAHGAANNALGDKQLTLASLRGSQQFACLVFFTRAFGAALGLRPVTAGAFEEVFMSREDYHGFWGELMPKLLSR